MLSWLFKKPWQEIERIQFQSPTAKKPDPLIISIEVRNKVYRKRVVRQIFEEEASEQDKQFYLTEYLKVVEYIDALNAGALSCSCETFFRLYEMAQNADKFEVVEDGEHVVLSGVGVHSGPKAR